MRLLNLVGSIEYRATQKKGEKRCALTERRLDIEGKYQTN